MFLLFAGLLLGLLLAGAPAVLAWLLRPAPAAVTMLAIAAALPPVLLEQALYLVLAGARLAVSPSLIVGTVVLLVVGVAIHRAGWNGGVGAMAGSEIARVKAAQKGVEK